MKDSKFSKVLIDLVLICVIIYLFFNIVNVRSKTKEVELEYSVKQQEYEDIQSQITLLNEDLKEIGSLKYIEKLAREEYGMVKPKEVIYIDRDINNSKD